ncbi:AraC family transcriptional regulator [Sphingobium mellinum]|uniref:AraC family transcriptional regulator n=1 Tax=Sphingobium mellinum TaxID=1387166 RepID=UPI0030EBDBA8
MPVNQIMHPTAAINRLVEAHFFRSDTSFQGDPASLPLDIRYVEAGGMAVVRVHGPGIGVRRTQHHIRERRANSFAIGLPLKGSISVTQAATRDLRVGEGSFVITSADKPFFHKTCPEEGRECLILNVLVPAHMFYQYFARDDHACGRSFPIASASARIASNLLDMLSREGDTISPASAAELGQAGLNALLTEARDQITEQSKEVSATAPHLRRALRYIDANFSQVGLTSDQVASACNFSRRYFYYILKEADIGFAEYLWTKRLQQANAWLARPLHDDLNIAEIAAQCGFQSASHFSTLYQAKFGRSPRQARSQRQLYRSSPEIEELAP